MKKTIFTLLLSLLLQVSFSQGATLTKGETVEYILNKLREVKEAKFYNSRDGQTFKYYDFNFSLTGNKITYTYKRVYLSDFYKDPNYRDHENIFNPVNMTTIELYKPSGWAEYGVSQMLIGFDGEVVRTNNLVEMTNILIFYFDNTEPQNFNRLKNAFLHLKDLITAEGDPFDN